MMDAASAGGIAISWAILVILGSLGVYRIGRMIPRGEEGPFGIAGAINGWALNNQRRHLARGLLCFFCQSFWLALGAAALIGAPNWRIFVLQWLGIAGLAVLWFRRLD